MTKTLIKSFVLLLVMFLASDTAFGQSASEVARRTFPSVVLIETNDQNGRAWSTESSMSVKPDVVAANFYFIDNESATNFVPKPNHQITEVNDPIGFSKRWLTERLTNYVWRSNSSGYYDGKPYNMTERITLFEFSGCVLRLEWENNFSWLAEKWEKRLSFDLRDVALVQLQINKDWHYIFFKWRTEDFTSYYMVKTFERGRKEYGSVSVARGHSIDFNGSDKEFVEQAYEHLRNVWSGCNK